MDFTSFIVHKRRFCLGILFVVTSLFLTVRYTYATQALNIQIDPPSPAYNQPFKCTLTLDQDDHRNACSLLPLGAAPGTFPWDICRIDHISADKLTRYYNCLANTDRHVPGPGQYQIVVWNFTGDGETGQVTASKNISILSALPPSPTNKPKPTITPPPLPTAIPPSLYPSIPPTMIPKQISPIIRPTQSIQLVLTTIAPSPIINRQDLSLKFFDDLSSSISSNLNASFLRTQVAILTPLWNILSRFLAETRF